MNIKVYKDLMGENERWASETRSFLKENNLRMLNIIGSPGCGKTTLLEAMTRKLAGRLRFAVLEGDVETTRDAERIARLDIPASQLLTGGACHLEAKLVHHALLDLPVDDIDMIIVENVGNLVCPAEFDIGEEAKIAVLSVTEGDDKPMKYPLLFREAGAAVITKTDLLPHVAFDLDACLGHINEINGSIPTMTVSATAGDGMDSFIEWLMGS